ncbi:hypothetical protein KIM67_09200 [Flagellimonas sp. 389]|uniref:alpha-mannosidase n=1 Tax=Flagellimonas sp. 389 TaxID=2835862 RepID=UPI001BD45224|nr:glycoside hydrolase family 38 C-terminal domain-containing protein [Flagellimonas sp. 389]MBS9462586.1 hypothetical protein [Flagellimonas sp. 389]
MKRYINFTILILIVLSSSFLGAQISEEQSEDILDYIRRAADGDHLALEGGHLALDGHVMPYPFFEAHEVLYLYRLSESRHKTIWKADSLHFKEGWNEDFPFKEPHKVNSKKVGANYISGGRHTYETYWFTVPDLPKKINSWERFLCIKPMEMALSGWPETAIYVNGKSKAALLRNHFYWATEQIFDDTKPNKICLKSYGVFDTPRGYRVISVVERDPLIDTYYWKLRVLIEAKSILSEEEVGYNEIKALADYSMNALDLNLSGTSQFRQKLEQVLPIISEKYKKLESLSIDQPTLKILAHGHLDTAWRWTLQHTDEKIERLVRNNLYLMDRYPEYKYVFTTPYHYERLSSLYPYLFEKVMAKMKEGQWIANGSTYVENDMNLPGNESIVRQFLYGLDYYQNKLDVEKNVLFLPDTFGFPRFLPQIAQGFGLDHLIGMRTISPEFEHTLYQWKGIDGSKLLVNGLSTPAWEYPFVDAVHKYRIKNPETITTYNAPEPGPRRLKGTWEQFKNKEVTDNQLLLIGWGDGGGGGTEDQIELKRSVSSLPSFPKTEWTTLHDYMTEQKKNIEKLAVFDRRILSSSWIHRTFLMANGIKTLNRKVEQRLREAEALSAMAEQFGNSYPREKTKKLWKSLLINHFHDIITGMAVPEVLISARDSLLKIDNEAKKIRDSKFDLLSEKLNMEKDGFVVFNPSGITMNGVTKIPNVTNTDELELQDSAGTATEYTVVDNQMFIAIDSLAPMSFKKYYWDEGKKTKKETELKATTKSLENELVKIVFNSNGEITSYFDKEVKKELVPKGQVWNKFYERTHKENGSLVPRLKISENTIETSPMSVTVQNPRASYLTASLDVEKKYKNSNIHQTILLKKGSKQLDFSTTTNWQEPNALEVAFPMTLKTDIAHYGIQWGHDKIARVDPKNTKSIDNTVCAFQWADVSDADYGIALFDNVRYGYNLKEGGIGLILSYGRKPHDYSEIKNLKWDNEASGDLDGETFSYALYPHRGNLITANVVQKAKMFNTPLLAKSVEKSTHPEKLTSLLRNLPDNIILQTIKKAEDGKGLIARLYETEKKTTTASMVLSENITTVFETDLSEKILFEIPKVSDTIQLEFKPFEIKTIRLKTNN